MKVKRLVEPNAVIERSHHLDPATIPERLGDGAQELQAGVNFFRVEGGDPGQ